MINVTKTFLPPFEEYTAVLKRAWDKEWITNNGELVVELEKRLREFLGVKHLIFCTNGTIALQIAIKALDIKGEVITTPFSYVATTTALLWEDCKPVFVDINNSNFCIDTTKMERAITENTKAILATHVYGHPCNIDEIYRIANKYKLKIIYDGAHAFGTLYKDNSIFNYGDISTCSFHATKLFHTGEGGCIITNEDELAKKIILYHQFGHVGDNYFTIGINGKNSELHAALGLCNLDYINSILFKRKEQWLYYESLLKPHFQLLKIDANIIYNYSYFPVLFKNEETLLLVIDKLKERNIYSRRYFFPSLNNLPYIKYQACCVSEAIAKRIVCLPLFFELDKNKQKEIADILLHFQSEKL